MKPRITVITLGVADVERAVRFYRDGLGLPTQGIIAGDGTHGPVAFFDLDAGLKLAVWGRDDIARDTGLAASAPCPTGFTIGHNVRRREDVEAVMARAGANGATVVKPAQATFWGGHAGYFQDPDGHVWEVVWNPDLLPPD